MKYDTTFRDGIEAALKALQQMLVRVNSDVVTAYADIRRNEQNMAVGALVTVEDTLEQALSLYHAIIAMHRLSIRRAT